MPRRQRKRRSSPDDGLASAANPFFCLLAPQVDKGFPSFYLMYHRGHSSWLDSESELQLLLQGKAQVLVQGIENERERMH